MGAAGGWSQCRAAGGWGHNVGLQVGGASRGLAVNACSNKLESAGDTLRSAGDTLRSGATYYSGAEKKVRPHKLNSLEKPMRAQAPPTNYSQVHSIKSQECIIVKPQTINCRLMKLPFPFQQSRMTLLLAVVRDGTSLLL